MKVLKGTELTIGADKSQNRPEITLTYDKQVAETFADVLVLCGLDGESAENVMANALDTIGNASSEEDRKAKDWSETAHDVLVSNFNYGYDLKVKAGLRTKELAKFKPVETTIRRQASDAVSLGFYETVEEAEADIRARLQARKDALASAQPAAE